MCINQIFPSYKIFEVSVKRNVSDEGYVDVYCICDETMNPLGRVSCTSKDRCKVTDAVIVLKPAVMKILKKLYKLGYAIDQKWICKGLPMQRKINKYGEAYLRNNLKLVKPKKILIYLQPFETDYFFIADADDATDYELVTRDKFTVIYRGIVGKLLNECGTDSIYFSYKNNNFTVDLSYEIIRDGWQDNDIRAVVSHSNIYFINNSLLKLIKKKNLYVPICDKGYVCNKQTDTFTLAGISCNKGPFCISLFLNVLLVLLVLLLIILSSWLFFTLRSWIKNNSKVVCTEVNMVDYEIPVDKNNCRSIRGEKIISQVESNDSSVKSEFLEYCTVYSNFPKLYVVRKEK